ncbi:SPOR domain-containing protein [Fibrella sp. HMF5405]|uniref:SPOR domain-containing protein n=2 Tax=Fibrella forsythiae TaxID=2817061 RepID=A0ABS3JJ77_9BACT|nr:SPOR domain-containing protein [Fibrella forsythiae]
MRLIGKWIVFGSTILVAWSCARTPATTVARTTTGSYNEYSEDLSAARPVYTPPTAKTAPSAPVPLPPGRVVDAPKRTGQVVPAEALHVNKRLDAILDTIAVQNRRVRYAPGYRVQVYVGNERAAADAAKLQLYQLFPELSAYMSYQQPTYRLKVGDFMKKMDAERYFTKLKAAFTSAQLQPDKVDVRRGLLIK